LTFIDPYWRGSGWIRSRGYLDTIRHSSDRDISATPVRAPISSLNDLYVGEINVLILSARVGRNANRSGEAQILLSLARSGCYSQGLI